MTPAPILRSRTSNLVSRIMHLVSFRSTVLLMFVSLGIPTRADAHLTNTGFGPFYDGLTHLFVTPEDLLQVIALSLLAGLRGRRFGCLVLFALPAAWLTGSIASPLVAPQVALPAATAVLTIALGAIVAADKPLPLAVIASIAILVGLFNGGLNGIELAKAGSNYLTAVGVVGSLFIAVSLIAGQVTSLHAAWSRIAVRVIGSWITASGLFMLGWAMRGA